jgi:glycosyltransferase involved in cell wall biosynthesis
VNPHGAIAGRLEGVPIVWQILDTLPPRALRRGLMPLVTRLAGAVMCTGDTVARAHPGAMGLGERLVLFFPPVDLELFRADPAVRSRSRSELGLGPDDAVVGTVGNLTPMKDHATLVRAAAVLQRMHPRTRFVILGSSYEHRGGYADDLLNAGKALGLQPHRDLILRDPGERVAELAQAFDVFWLSSKSRSEGLPTVLGEAMALGLPVVATRVGSVAEAVGKGGFLVPPRDPGALARAAAQLIEDPSARATIGEEGRRRASERFSVEASADAHIRAFEIALRRASLGAAA